MFRIERITKRHNTRQFDCGEADLNGFLKQFALKNDANDVGRTYVAVRIDSSDVVGYYTISTGSVRFSELPPELKLPRYPIPTAHIGKLATDLSVRGQRLGEALLYDALEKAEATSQKIGLKAVDLIALNEKAKKFYLRYGFKEMKSSPMHLFLAMDTVRQLVK